MNKYILSSFLLLSASTLLAQQSKFFIEAGGSYQKNKYKQQSENFKNSYLSKTPAIGTALGFQLSGHSALGVRYTYGNLSYERNSTFIHSQGYSESSYKTNTKTNGFGVFYRYYIRDKETSKWNIFAEFSPSYQKSKELYTELNISYNSDYQDSPKTLTDDTINSKLNSLDGSVSVGSSYQLSSNWALQLSLRSIMQIQHQLGDHKATQYRFFEQILSNNFFSVQYQF